MVRSDKLKLIGQILDKKYHVTSLIGEGGMGAVYKGTHVHLKRECAIKVMRRQLADDPIALKRFRLEAESASRLKHPHIIDVYDSGVTDDDLAYIAMEFLVGSSLQDKLKKNRFISQEQAIPIFLQVCDALAHAHERQVIHRDLKPGNIMLVETERGEHLAKLVDFGIAKILPGLDQDIGERLTLTGEVIGSPLYMSPEQCMGKTLDGRTDIYSLGCVFYETLTGKPPFDGDSFVQVVMKQVSESPLLFSESLPGLDIPADLESIVQKCLEKNAADRFSNVRELRQSLLNLQQGLPFIGLESSPRVRDTMTKTVQVSSEMTKDPEQDSLEQLIVAHLSNCLGAPTSAYDYKYPSGPAITIYRIDPNEDRDYYVLFSTGMSARPSAAPEDWRGFRYTELLFCLPSSWPMHDADLQELANHWPLSVLEELARKPYELAGSFVHAGVVIASEVLQPNSAITRFSAVYLDYPRVLGDKSQLHDIEEGRTICFLSLIPLYGDEWQYLQANGTDSFLALFDAARVSEVLDLERPSVCK